jgi:hypothetical protein
MAKFYIVLSVENGDIHLNCACQASTERKDEDCYLRLCVKKMQR